MKLIKQSEKTMAKEHLGRRRFLVNAGKAAAAIGLGSWLDFSVFATMARGEPAAEVAGYGTLLLQPTTFCPAIVRPGESVNASLMLPESVLLKNVTLISKETGATIPAKLEKSKTSVNDPSAFSLIPSGLLSSGAYDLKIEFDENGKPGIIEKPRAVWCGENTGGAFTFVILADYHVGDPRGKKIARKMDFPKLRNHILKEVSSIKPEFVLFAGDITYSPGQYGIDYAVFSKEIVMGLSVPVFVMPGNHDLMNVTVGNLWNVQGHDYWLNQIGPLHHSFTYGNHRFIGLNTYDRSGTARDVSKILDLGNRKAMWAAANGGMGFQQFEWLRTELEDARKKGQMISVFGHHSPLDDMEAVDSVTKEELVSPEQFVKTLQDSGVHNYFYGHKHTNRHDERVPLTLTCTGTSGSDLGGGDGWGFRIVEVNGDRLDSRYVEVEPHPKRGRVPAGTSAK